MKLKDSFLRVEMQCHQERNLLSLVPVILQNSVAEKVIYNLAVSVGESTQENM